MKNDITTCDKIRSQLLELNSTESLNNSMQEHINQCQACASYYQDILTLNQGLESMPVHDVSDEVFEETLVKIQNSRTTSQTKGINPQWATGLAASFVLVAMVGLIYSGSLSEFGADFNQAPMASKPAPKPKQEKNLNRQNNPEPDHQQGLGTTVDVIDIEDLDVVTEVRSRNMSVISSKATSNTKGAISDTLDEIMADESAPVEAPFELDQSGRNGAFDDAKSVSDRVLPSDVELGGSTQVAGIGRITVTGSRIQASDHELEPGNKPEMSLDQQLQVVQRSAADDSLENLRRGAQFKKQNSFLANEDSEKPTKDKRAELAAGFKPKSKLVETKESLLTPGKSEIEKPRRDEKLDGLVEIEEAAVGYDDYAGGVAVENPMINTDTVNQYLSKLQNIDNLTFKAASGYWANTYLPGDPDMRWIQAKLSQDGGLNLPMVQQNIQPFDFPNNAALGLYLNSDQKSLNESGPTRMRLQVGIQAGQQKGGHRSALNLAVVLDLGQFETGLKSKSIALLNALLKAKQPSDHVSVYFTGQAGINEVDTEQAGEALIKAEDFRHGPIQVAMNQVFNQSQNVPTSAQDLHKTLLTANAWLKSQDDPNTVLGSSSVLLISANNELDYTSEIKTLIQQNAIDGITLSTVAISTHESKLPLQKLAMMGQGHSRVLSGAKDAERLINEQLLVSSRAVARALRLQIKLAEGVQLIDVLDSYSLDEKQAQMVRNAEQSLDQRMAKNLGITADRGKDDDGIQMVIPSYFAGDTHVILLDVLVQKPGPVVEVIAKYKDLIYLRNATSQKSLELATGQNKPGPLELNVMKNVLTHHLSQSVKKASLAIRVGDTETAVMKLQTILELYQAMRKHIPAWKSDAEMIQDETIIQRYLQLLNSQSSINPEQYQLIADSMSFMSWRKLINPD